jgi:hypothetical protein
LLQDFEVARLGGKPNTAAVPGGPFTNLDADRITAVWSKMRESLGLADEQDFDFSIRSIHGGAGYGSSR